MRKFGFFGLGALIAAGAFAFASAGDPAPERVGYFKSEDGNRVMAYVAPEGMAPAEARAYLGDVMHTPGKLTFAVIYPQGAAHPGHRLTAAPDYLTAAGLLDAAPHDGWTWGALVNIAGRVQFQER